MPATEFILTGPHVPETSAPSVEALRCAIDAVAVSRRSNPGGPPAETSVRYTTDAGPAYVLTYSSAGRLSFEQFADPELATELAAASHLPRVRPAEALQLMHDLGSGAIAHVLQQPWQPGR
jgi:hypothetical protein